MNRNAFTKYFLLIALVAVLDSGCRKNRDEIPRVDFTIDMQDPGASYANNQPPAGGNQGDMLTMQTTLVPFTREDGSYFVSADCVDIESQLGYSYGPGSLDALAEPPDALVRVEGGRLAAA